MSVIDTTTNSVIDTISVGHVPEYAGMATDGDALLATGATFIARTSAAFVSTLASGPTGSLGPVFTGGTLEIAGANIVCTLPVTLESQGGIINTDGNNATLTGTISGSGSLTKTGLGTLILDGSSTYTGGTILSGGILELSGPSSTPVTFTANANATLRLDSPSTFTGTVSGLASGDCIDLPNIKFADHPKIKFNQKTHILTVTDPLTHVTDSVKILGPVTSFSISSDGSGGTLITDKSLNQLIQAMATFGPSAGGNDWSMSTEFTGRADIVSLLSPSHHHG